MQKKYMLGNFLAMFNTSGTKKEEAEESPADEINVAITSTDNKYRTQERSAWKEGAKVVLIGLEDTEESIWKNGREGCIVHTTQE